MASFVDRWDLRSWCGIGGVPERIANRRTEKTALALGRGADRGRGSGTRHSSRVGFLVEKRVEPIVACEADRGRYSDEAGAGDGKGATETLGDMGTASLEISMHNMSLELSPGLAVCEYTQLSLGQPRNFPCGGAAQLFVVHVRD